ncbi:hypothetical protein D9M71_185630 [compost metagenome]
MLYLFGVATVEQGAPAIAALVVLLFFKAFAQLLSYPLSGKLWVCRGGEAVKLIP